MLLLLYYHRACLLYSLLSRALSLSQGPCALGDCLGVMLLLSALEASLAWVTVGLVTAETEKQVLSSSSRSYSKQGSGSRGLAGPSQVLHL